MAIGASAPVRVSKQTLSLIRLAVNPASAPGEASNAALAACKQLVQAGILGDSFVMPEAEPVQEAPTRQASYDARAGGVQADNVADFFGGMGAAAASARRYAEAEDLKRRRSTISTDPIDPGCDHGVTFDCEASIGLSVPEIQRRWPRGWFTEEKPCPKCGFFGGIVYASQEHMIAGDW
jgi:hypothetical protein